MPDMAAVQDPALVGLSPSELEKHRQVSRFWLFYHCSLHLCAVFLTSFSRVFVFISAPETEGILDQTANAEEFYQAGEGGGGCSWERLPRLDWRRDGSLSRQGSQSSTTLPTGMDLGWGGRRLLRNNMNSSLNVDLFFPSGSCCCCWSSGLRGREDGDGCWRHGGQAHTPPTYRDPWHDGPYCTKVDMSTLVLHLVLNKPQILDVTLGIFRPLNEKMT